MSDLEISERLCALEKRVMENARILISEEGARDKLSEVAAAERVEADKWRLEQSTTHQAQLFLLSEITARRASAIESIEAIGSAALRQVYGAGYGMRFETFEEKRREGSPAFKMEIKICSPHEDGVLETGVFGERGGGLAETVAFALRIAALNWMQYDGPLILDEAWKSMSDDDKLESVALFLHQVTQETGRQIIFATHKSAVFGKYASRIIKIEKDARHIASASVLEHSQEDLEVEEEFS